MPLSVLFLRFAGPLVLVNRPRHVHGRNTAGPLHPYYYGFQRVEHPITGTSGVAVPAPGRRLPGDLHRRVHRIPGLPARGQARHLHDGRNRRIPPADRRPALLPGRDRGDVRCRADARSAGSSTSRTRRRLRPGAASARRARTVTHRMRWGVRRPRTRRRQEMRQMPHEPRALPLLSSDSPAATQPGGDGPGAERCPEIAPRMSPTWARRRIRLKRRQAAGMPLRLCDPPPCAQRHADTPRTADQSQLDQLPHIPLS